MSSGLKVSIASDIIDDSMSVELHLNDRPIIKAIIKDNKNVVFPGISTEEVFSFDDVRELLKEFIEKMESTENVSV